jgi:DNA-binding transcriptional ArsR family regulator
MSVQAMTWAWEQHLDPSDKLVLLALANRTNHETGVCYPGQKLLAKECSMSDRSVRRHLKNLEDLGLIERRARMRKQGRGRTSDEYRIAFFQQDNLSTKSGPTGQTGTTNRTNMHDQPDTGVQTRTEREPEEETLAAAPQEKPAKKKDELFEAIASACGIDIRQLTGSSRGQLNKATKELRDIGAEPGEVEPKAKAYRKLYENAALTPSALVKHWPSLTVAKQQRQQPSDACPECYQPWSDHDQQIHDLQAGRWR